MVVGVGESISGGRGANNFFDFNFDFVFDMVLSLFFCFVVGGEEEGDGG